ncbi:MAG TPA: enoyl-CoA hydratase/isomerase family protein [Candidatus Dormibacteraeota bacterium]|nr:enoyl-CoA hydratase/isomerase family protein [Candidatus Dormibacteraeota bacterium]
MSSELVLTSIHEGVLEVTLNRPEKRNALSIELFEAMGDAFQLAAEPRVRAVLVRGSGPVFCAGIDLDSLASLAGNRADGAFLSSLHHLQDIYMRLERIGKPSVASMQGAAVGAGLQLGLACDLRVAADDLRMGVFEIHYGIVPDLGGIHRLVQLCGPSRAKDLAMTGRDVSPEEAMRIGLVDRVVPVADLDQSARSLVGEIAAKAPLAVQAIKRLSDNAAGGQSPEDNLRDVGEAQVECLAHPDMMEAVSARMQKRVPVFSAE